MTIAKNQFGIPQYPENDARRLLILLAAIDLLERPTVSAIADLTGYDKETVDIDVLRLRNEFGVVLPKIGEIYHIESWGDILKKNGVKRLLKE